MRKLTKGRAQRVFEDFKWGIIELMPQEEQSDKTKS